MKAQIVTIGDEILIGQIVDTNSAWLGEQLNLLGIAVNQITSISDDKEAIRTTLDHALTQNEVTFVTGGLGPTKDDITKLTLSEMFNSPLVRNDECYYAVETLCKRIGLEFNELNQGQASVPQCCTAIVNDNGTAPAMVFKRDGHLLISLPGVPFEMKPLCSDKIFPMLKELFSLKHNIHVSVNIFGIPESVLAAKIEMWETALPSWLHLAYLPSPQRIRLRLSAYEMESEAQARDEINSQFETLKAIIPNNFIGGEQESLENTVHRLLTERRETLSVAESCTGGAIASLFTAMAGASAYFKGGVIAYSNDVKQTVLGVSIDNLNRYGAVSEQVVCEMAEGARKLTNSTFAIATSGIAGPEGGTEDKPVGTIWMAISTPSGTFAQKKVFTKLREQNIEYATARAVSILRDYLLNH